jgi:ATP-dependent RNA helicase SUPV3L1/SUV3
MTSLLGCSGEDFASILTSLGYRLRRTPKIVTPVPAAEVPAAEVTDSAALNAVEGAAAPADNGLEKVETAAADLGGPVLDNTEPATPEADAEPVPAAEAGPVIEAKSAAETKSAEPEFDEVWFPGSRRSEQNRRPPRRNAAPADAEGGEAPEARRNDRPRHTRRSQAATPPRSPQADGAAPQSEGGRPPRGNPSQSREERKPFNGGGKSKFENRPDKAPRRDKPAPSFDPDSPFAALAALRNRKPE